MVTRSEAIAALMDDISVTTSGGQTYTVPDPLNRNSNLDSPWVLDWQYAGTSQPADLPTSTTFTGWTAFTPAEMTRFEELLDYVETIANVDFQKVSGQADPTMNVGKVDLPGPTTGIGGWGYSISFGGGAAQLADYDNFVNFDNTLSLASGEDNLILHEVMHALSLEHPFEGADQLPAAFENNKYSVLSYSANPDNGQRSDGLQLFDILAVQYRWGANMDTATGDDTYTGKRNTTVDAIWDAGGEDTFDASSRTSAVEINLTAGEFSSFDSVDDVVIAYDVVIENAIGGSGNDSIIGNSASNFLAGNAGDDTLKGGSGNDDLQGGVGADVMRGGNGNDRAYYFDALSGLTADLQSAGRNTGIATGDTYDSIERLFGTKFADELRGDGVGNVLWGHNGDDVIYGRDGRDVLFGGRGADLMHGGSGLDRAQYTDAKSGVTADLQSAASNTGIAAGDTYVSIEQLYGSAFDDALRGDAGKNTLWGYHGDDVLRGRDGNDILVGGEGQDTLLGGAGQDRAQYADSKVGLTVDLQNAAQNTGIAAGDTFTSIEDLRGSYYDDDLRGDQSANSISGLAGNDEIDGRGGNDSLDGDAGNDTLIGGSGSDTLEGGSGADTFAFADGFGSDVLVDFDINEAGETIDLRAVTSITDYNDLMTNHVFEILGETLIDDLAGNTVLLAGLLKADLSSNDFTLV